MPVFTRRQHIMTDTPRASVESATQENIWVVQEDYERPQKEMDFPTTGLNSKMPRHDLRIHTYSKPDLHERYMSSEEEPSPSPDSSDAESTHSEELKHKSSARVLATEEEEEAPIDLAALESDSETAVAVAMPIVAFGRPKLIDISSLAPLQKRKRAIKQPIAPSSTMNKQSLSRKVSSISAEHKPFAANEAAEMTVPAEKLAVIAQKQAAMAANKRLKEQQLLQTPRPSVVSSAPESWLPEEEEEDASTAADDEREYHFPSDPSEPLESLDIPIIINPPRPSPSRLSHRSSQTTVMSRKRTNSNPFAMVNTTSLGKGITKTWSIAKKVSASSGSSSHPSERQLNKKPKMIARGANEREEGLVLPPFETSALA
ncbi:MAG: hypothetical protein Q9183_002646 [Haloplaca sp. 2 TL-2023]